MNSRSECPVLRPVTSFVPEFLLEWRRTRRARSSAKVCYLDGTDVRMSVWERGRMSPPGRPLPDAVGSSRPYADSQAMITAGAAVKCKAVIDVRIVSRFHAKSAGGPSRNFANTSGWPGSPRFQRSSSWWVPDVFEEARTVCKCIRLPDATQAAGRYGVILSAFKAVTRDGLAGARNFRVPATRLSTHTRRKPVLSISTRSSFLPRGREVSAASRFRHVLRGTCTQR